VSTTLVQLIPKEGAQIVLVLFLSFLIGLEREEQKVLSSQYRFGGVRSFPLLGLLGYALCLISDGALLAPAVGLAAVGAFLWQSYRHKLDHSSTAGMTTELSGLLTYAIGALVWREDYWAATTIAVLAVVLLELKDVLEAATRRVAPDEILTFAKFLLLTAVILPVVPNQTFGTFGFNPFRLWLVVVAVSAISYGSYLLQMWARGRGGVLLSAMLGGAYSSTLTTVVLARRARGQARPHLYAGSMLMASGVMYLRLLALLALFNRALLQELGVPFLLLAAGGVGVGWLWTRRSEATGGAAAAALTAANPLEVRAAFLFGVVFVVVMFLTHATVTSLGRAGLFTLAGLMGVTDVDPFILSLTQSSASLTPVGIAAAGIVIAAASNNAVKGLYARGFAGRAAGTQGLVLLFILAAAGLLPLFLFL